MPLFFFHFIEGDERCEDELGLQFASAEAAYLEAVATAQGMWTELLMRRSNPSRCAFEIANDGGELLFRLDFAELLGTHPPSIAHERSQTLGLVRSLRATHLRVTAARASVASSLANVQQALRESNELISQLGSFGRPQPRA